MHKFDAALKVANWMVFIDKIVKKYTKGNIINSLSVTWKCIYGQNNLPQLFLVHTALYMLYF